jgi:hypothetical protein
MMSKNELDTIILEYHCARTPEQKQAWCERWGEEILRELGAWIAGENENAEEYDAI